MFSLLNSNRMELIQLWCGVTCSRTGGALLATAGFQALGKSDDDEWHIVRYLGKWSVWIM
ncbi:MAG: hypothetical protein GY779_06480 [Gammaproteobacteria bacterium]|nr:hypothetical protein [Gammaproteobacteria bacterium]